MREIVFRDILINRRQIKDAMRQLINGSRQWEEFYRNSHGRQQLWAEGHGYLSLEYGPGYWVFILCGTIIPYTFTLYALLRVCVKKPDYAADV